MRYSALENDIGLDACQSAGGVEGTAGYEAGIQHKGGWAARQVISIAPLFPSINGACEAASRFMPLAVAAKRGSSGWNHVKLILA
ncbi:MAG: hypothetical protein IPP85_16485 [Propionivibrio sp.]|nr:hypothetical protein [Propionivibrio sp.]